MPATAAMMTTISIRTFLNAFDGFGFKIKKLAYANMRIRPCEIAEYSIVYIQIPVGYECSSRSDYTAKTYERLSAYRREAVDAMPPS